MPNNSKFTPARRKALLELLKKAVPIGIACDKVGIDRTTYYLWKNRAERYNPVDKDTKDDKPYHDFFQKIHEARAAAFQQLLNEIMHMGMGYEATEKIEEYRQTEDDKIIGQKKIRVVTRFIRHPQALIFLAERLFPAYFGNRLRLDVEGIDELILRELLRIDRRGESHLSGRTPQESLPQPDPDLAGDSEPDQSQDWEDLPPQLPGSN